MQQANLAFSTDQKRLRYTLPINHQPRPSTSSQESVNNYPTGPSLEDVTCWRRLTRQLAEKEAEKQSVLHDIERFRFNQERRYNLLEKQKKERRELVLLEETEAEARSRE